MTHASPATPPQNTQAEAAVLGSLLVDPQYALPKVQPLLRPQHFYYRLKRNNRPKTWGITIARLAVALQTSTDYLLGLTDDPTPYPSPQSEKETG